MKKAKVKVRLVSNDFSETTKEEMWQLYRQYYHYSKEDFMQRIAKNNYYSMYRSEGRLVGFTGLRIHRMKGRTGRKLLIYYGQTVIEKEFRGKSLLPRTAGKLCLRFFWDLITSKVFFWADCLTYKAYLVFAKTVEEYYPSYKKQNPAEIKQILDRIGMMNYRDTYCPETGTVKKDKVLVNDKTSFSIRPEYARDPDVTFFQQANPNYISGHGLITLTPMNWKNISLIFERLIWKGAKKTKRAQLPVVGRQATQTKEVA